MERNLADLTPEQIVDLEDELAIAWREIEWRSCALVLPSGCTSAVSGRQSTLAHPRAAAHQLARERGWQTEEGYTGDACYLGRL
jgi:hypothetical protein